MVGLKGKIVLLFALASVIAFASATDARAELPLVNLDGVGGIALNPIAYPSNPVKEGEDGFFEQNWLGKPSAAMWYVSLGEIDADWTTLAFNVTLFNRVEVGYSRQIFATDLGAVPTIQKDNIGLKLLVLPEGSFDNEWMPAFSIGTIYRHTEDESLATGATGNDGVDFYFVLTKLLAKPIPGYFEMPTILSLGMMSTEAHTLGFFGYPNERDETFFADVNVIVAPWLAAGVAYTQGPDFNASFARQDIWEYHLAWILSENMTMVTAYVDAGDDKDLLNAANRGLGDGFCFSLNYDF